MIIPLDITPFGYSNPNCKKVDLKIKFMFDQYSETIKAIISCETTPDYNLIWMSPTAKDLNIVDASSFKKLLRTNYKHPIILSRYFKKQIKLKKIDKIEGVKTEQCEFANLIADDNVRFANMFGLLKNEMFDLNKMITTNSKIELVFNILYKSNHVKISLPTFIPASKDNLAFSSGKIKFQYAAIPENFEITILRDPCLIASEEIKKQIDILKKEYSDEEQARGANNKSECEKIKEKSKTENEAFKQKYKDNQCNEVIEILKDYDKLIESILIFECEADPCKNSLKDSVQISYDNINSVCQAINILKDKNGNEKEIKMLKTQLREFETENNRFKEKYKSLNPPCNKIEKLINSNINKIRNYCAEGKAQVKAEVKAGGNLPPVKLSEINSAFDQINDLYNNWGKTVNNNDEFKKIVTKIDAKINNMDEKSKAKFKKEIDAYKKMVQMYIKKTNYK